MVTARCSQASLRDTVSPARPRSSLGPPLPGTPHQGDLEKGILSRCPNRFVWLLLMWGSSDSNLTPSRMTEFLSPSLGVGGGESSDNLRRKQVLGLLYPQWRSFGHNPQLVTINEGGTTDRAGNQAARLRLHQLRTDAKSSSLGTIYQSTDLIPSS